MKKNIIRLFILSKDESEAENVSIKDSDNSVFVDCEKFINALKGLGPDDKVKIQNITV
jgi:hypothetical protein